MADDLVTTNDWMATGDLMVRDDWFIRTLGCYRRLSEGR